MRQEAIYVPKSHKKRSHQTSIVCHDHNPSPLAEEDLSTKKAANSDCVICLNRDSSAKLRNDFIRKKTTVHEADGSVIPKKFTKQVLNIFILYNIKIHNTIKQVK